ncbi:MAG: hypothetical protein KAI96_03925 [Thermodesulfovibrionia bacterium]|nr:hypothetical protein [Thermodesulfovibrionia bacterium]
MKNGGKRKLAIEKEIERFCQGTAKVLIKIYERIDEEQSKQKKKTR